MNCMEICHVDVPCPHNMDCDHEGAGRIQAWNKECPVCGEYVFLEMDIDFPKTLMNCDRCGSEWNEDEITLNSREDV